MVQDSYSQKVGGMGIKITPGICTSIGYKTRMAIIKTEHSMGGSHPSQVYLAIDHHKLDP